MINGDGWAEAGDSVDVRFIRDAEEHAGVRAKRLDIAALALRVNGIKSLAGLAGAGEASQDYELVARNVNIDVFEVVLARAADFDEVVVTIHKPVYYSMDWGKRLEV